MNADNNTNTVAAPVSTGAGQTDYKRALAYRSLGIRPQDVPHVPFFRAELRRIARLMNRRLETGEPAARPLECLQASDDSEGRKVLAAYLSVPASYRKLLPGEAFCHAAGVCPVRILELIAGIAVRQGAQASAIVAAINHPRVVMKTVERALQDGGTREREMLHRAMAFL